MIDPQQVVEMLNPTGTLSATAILPTRTVKPIPTVIPTPPQFQLADEHGHRALWVVFVIMVLASAAFTGLSWKVPLQRRLYHVATTTVTIVAALAYFAMATGGGKRLRCDRVTDSHDNVPDTSRIVCREVYWARYADWAITTPLLLLDLCLLAGVNGAHTLMAVLADLVMVLGGLFAALGRERSAQRWGWFAIACVGYLFVIWHVVVPGLQTVRAKGSKAVRLFAGLGIFTLLLWTAYPIVWGIAEGARKTTVNTEIYIYAVLDILAKVVFGFWLLLSHRTIPETNVELTGYWTHGLAPEGRIRLGEDDEV